MSVTFSVYYSGEGLPYDAEERYSTVVVAVVATVFLLPALQLELMDMVEEGGLLASLDYLWGDTITSWGFAAGEGGNGLVKLSSSTEGGTSSSSMTGRGDTINCSVSDNIFPWYSS